MCAPGNFLVGFTVRDKRVLAQGLYPIWFRYRKYCGFLGSCGDIHNRSTSRSTILGHPHYECRAGVVAARERLTDAGT